jgi:hypothetical protein
MIAFWQACDVYVVFPSCLDSTKCGADTSRSSEIVMLSIRVDGSKDAQL